MTAQAPLFACENARIEGESGAALSDALTFAADGARVVLVGAWEPFVTLLTGRATLAGGTATVLGAPPDRAVFDNQLGLALRDPPLPEKPTALEHLTASARLLGKGRRDARREAESVLERLGLTRLAKTRLRVLYEMERRALYLAHALLGAPPAIFVERPFEGLDDTAADLVEGLVGEAARGRRVATWVTSPGTGPDRRAATQADHVVALAQGSVVASGPPAAVFGSSRRFVVWAAREGTALSNLLSTRGHAVSPLSGVDAGAGEGDGAARFVVRLPEGADDDAVVAAALEVRAPLIELSPLELPLRPGP